MKPLPQILALLITVTIVPAVDSWPASVLARRSNDTNRSNDQQSTDPRSVVAGTQSTDTLLKTPANTKLVHSNQMLAREASMSNHPSSQTSEREFSMQPKDSSRPLATTKRTDSIQTNKQNYSGVYSRPNHLDFDSLSEGSGIGPQQNGKNGNSMKLDDTEISGDDDEDDDEDYDYRDTMDSGSGFGQIKSSTTKRPEPVAKEALSKAQSNDPYNPFRPPIVEPDAIATTTTGALIPPMTTTSPVVIVTTRAPLRVPTTTPAALSTTTSYPKISTSTTTSRNLVVSANKYNGTRAEADYDYEDENEDDDSADSSAFEDNEPNEMIAINKPSAKPQTNSSSNTQANNSNGRFNFVDGETAIKLPVLNVASSTDQTARPNSPMATETPAPDYGHRQTNSRPLTTQKMTSKPATTKPTAAPQPTRPGQSHKFDDLDEEEERVPEEEENEEEEDEEEDEEELDDDILDNDHDEEEPILGLGPPKHSKGRSNATQHTRPFLNSTPEYPTANLPTTRKPRPPTFSTTLSPSQNRDDLANFQPSTTTYNPNVISATTFATNQISSVPIFSSTTASSTTTNVVVNNPLKPSAGGGTIASQPVFAQPTRIPTVSSAYRPTLSSAIDQLDSKISTLSNPSSRSPTSQVTTTATNILHNGLPHDNGDTLTKQIYAKALELYREADKKVRAAWEAVWPPNLNFDSSAVEPLLNQPLFFMLALGGTVIGLVLLMMLVVYIITYQIQPKDDDSSIY